MQVQAQELLPQKVAVDGTAGVTLSIVQWVKPKTPGVLKGDIFAPVLGGAAVVVDDAVVVLRGKDGWVGKGETNRLGRFTVTDVEPGAYSLMVKAPGLFAFYAIQVAAENDVDAHTYPERAAVSCAFIEETAVKRMAKHVKDELTIDEVKMAPEGVEVAQRGVVAGHCVATLSDGRFSGVLYQPGSGFLPAAGEDITLLQDGLKVATAVTGENGQFEIPGLDTGIYAFVARGKSGVAVVGIEMRAGKARDGQAQVGTTSEARFVSLLQQPSSGFSIQAAPNNLDDTSDPPAETRPPVVASGGGGGGGGGGGAAAALLAAAAAGAAINDGGGGSIASPAAGTE